MQLVLTPLSPFPLVARGDDLGRLILEALQTNAVLLQDGDVIIVGQKIVSKSEGRAVDLSTVLPSARARDIATETGKDARLVELILQESRRVVRTGPGLIIVEHRLGFVCANAGIDHSNVGPPERAPQDWVLLLPENPDGSAAAIRARLEEQGSARIGVMIIDSHGRPWRIGTVGVSIGLSGVAPLVDQRGWADLFGYRLRATVVAAADELAAGASLMMGQAAEGTPVVHARGFPYPLHEGRFEEILRPANEDLFR